MFKKIVSTCILFISLLVSSLSVYSNSFEQGSYLGFSFGELKAKERARLLKLFSELKPGLQTLCLYDGNFYASLYVENDISKLTSILHSVALTAAQPDIICSDYSAALPSFSGFEPGMFSFEFIVGLREKDFYQSSTSTKSAVYKKDYFSDGRCYRQAANDFSEAYQYYGVNRKTIEYTLSGVSKSAVSSIEKRITEAHVEDSMKDCSSADIASASRP